MLFLHGGGVSGWAWDKQVQYFTGCHCIVPDLPEHGTVIQHQKFTIQESAEEVTRLIEEKGNGKKVIVVGFSLGSQILIHLLSKKASVVDFAFINSALVIPVPHARIFIGPVLQLAYPLIKKRWFSRLQAKELNLSNDDFEKYYEESSQMKLDTLLRILTENMGFEIPDGFNKANAKILVTVGEKEKTIMQKSANIIVHANTNCKGVIIPGVGHGFPSALPDFFNQLIEKWINEEELPMECKVIR